MDPDYARLANDMVKSGEANDFSHACSILARRRRNRDRRSARRRKPPERRKLEPMPARHYWWQD